MDEKRGFMKHILFYVGLFFIALSFFSSVYASNVLIIADSIGCGNQGDKPFPVVLQEICPQHKIINDSIGGSITASGYDRLEKGLKNNHIDVVIVTLGINDIGHKRPLQEIYNNFTKMASLCEKKHVRLILGTIDALSYIHMTNDKNYCKTFNNIYYHVQNIYKVETFRFLYKEIIPYTIDGFHLNQCGQNIIANKISKKIQ